MSAPKLLRRILTLLLTCVSFMALPCSMWGAGTPYATKISIATNTEVSLYTPTMFRVRTSQMEGEKFPAKYEIPFVMGRTEPWAPVEFRRWEEGDADLIETSAIRIRIPRKGGNWTVWMPGGKDRIYPSDGPTYGMFRDGYAVFDSAGALDQTSDYSRYSHWFYNPQTRRYVDTYLADDLIMDQFFIYGPEYDRLYKQLSQLAGPEPLLPKKAYGFFQTQHLGCKGDQKQFMEVAQKLRDRHIPADTMILDYEWGDGCPGGDADDKYWGGLDWAEAYKTPLSPREMVAKLHEMHFDLMLIHHSAPNFPHRAEEISRNPKRQWTSKVYDEQLWWNKLREQLDLGVRGTWQDTRKNDVTDSVIWQGLQDLYGTSQRVLFMGNRNMVEVDPWELQRDDRTPSNSLLASRRYPFRWTGDAHTTWSELQWHIDAITNTFGPMAGIDYITADAYAADWKQEARWSQFLAFTPVARSHNMKPWDVKLDIESLTKIMAFGDKRKPATTVATMPTVPGTEAADAATEQLIRDHTESLPTAEASIRETLRLRYRLLPYIYSTAYHQYASGFPMVRPMVLAFPNDLHCKFNRERYQYMFGDSFLVAPVWADLNSMEIYLPEGSDWIDYWSKQTYPGGHTIVYDTSHVERLPLFVKAGSIVPMRPDAEWIDPAVPDDPLTLDVYPGSGTSRFTLYEDDGVTTLYQSGRFATTEIERTNEANGDVTMRIGPAMGDYKGKPSRRTVRLTVNAVTAAPAVVLRNDVPLEKPDGRWTFDAKAQQLQISVAVNTSQATTIRVVQNSR